MGQKDFEPRLKSFYANHWYGTLQDCSITKFFYEKNDFIYCAYCKNAEDIFANKISEFLYLKTTLLLMLRVLSNIYFIKYFDFVYEKVEILKNSTFLLPAEHQKSNMKPCSDATQGLCFGLHTKIICNKLFQIKKIKHSCWVGPICYQI